MVLPVRIIMSPNSSSTCLVEIHARSLIAGPLARTGTDTAPPCALVPRRAMTRVYLFAESRCWPLQARVLGLCVHGHADQRPSRAPVLGVRGAAIRAGRR